MTPPSASGPADGPSLAAARDVGAPELLRMLALLTAALDVAAAPVTGPV